MMNDQPIKPGILSALVQQTLLSGMTCAWVVQIDYLFLATATFTRSLGTAEKPRDRYRVK